MFLMIIIEERDPKRRMISKSSDCRLMSTDKENDKRSSLQSQTKNRVRVRTNRIYFIWDWYWKILIKYLPSRTNMSSISDKLDDVDDFDISELYRKIPPKTRAAVEF